MADNSINIPLMIVEHAPTEAGALREQAKSLRVKADECEHRAMVLDQLYAIAAPLAPRRLLMEKENAA